MAHFLAPPGSKNYRDSLSRTKWIKSGAKSISEKSRRNPPTTLSAKSFAKVYLSLISKVHAWDSSTSMTSDTGMVGICKPLIWHMISWRNVFRQIGKSERTFKLYKKGTWKRDRSLRSNCKRNRGRMQS